MRFVNFNPLSRNPRALVQQHILVDSPGMNALYIDFPCGEASHSASGREPRTSVRGGSTFKQGKLKPNSGSYAAVLGGVFGVLVLFCGVLAFAQDKYSMKEKDYMLNLARQTLTWYLKYDKIPQPPPEALTDNLKANRPCFVTLNKRGYGLRGCVGMFEFTQPLYKNIISRSILAATQDHRFPMPVVSEELKDILIEISILTEPKQLLFTSPQDLLKKLQPTKDGVILYTDYGSSTYLPQVWEQLPDKEMFLSSLCQKHGAPPYYWKDNYERLRVEIYHAVHFAEDGYGKKIVGPYGAIAGKGGAQVIGQVSFCEEETLPQSLFVEEGKELAAGAVVTESSEIVDKKANQ